MISQREAQRLRKRVQELETADEVRRADWARDYPGGVHIASITLLPDHRAAVSIHVARRLKHAVVAVDSGEQIHFYALPQ